MRKGPKIDKEILPENHVVPGAVYEDSKNKSIATCVAVRDEDGRIWGEFKAYGFRMEPICQGTARMRQMKLIAEPFNTERYASLIDDMVKQSQVISELTKEIAVIRARLDSLSAHTPVKNPPRAAGLKKTKSPASKPVRR